VRCAGQVRRRLRIYAKYSAIGRLTAYGQLATQFAMRYLTGFRKNKVLQTGGAVIAFVGPEATGKSTLVREAKQWLGSAFATQAVHVGKPPSTWLTTPINGILPLGRKLLPQWRTSRVEGHVVEPQKVASADTGDVTATGTTSVLYALRAVAVAWDRRHLLLNVRRAAANGAIVICDRYPSEMVGAMDSARLRPDPAKRGIKAAIFNRLARLEEKLYQQMPPPDVVLRLSVALETAKERNRTRVKVGKEADAYIESRHRQVRDWRKAGTIHIHEIDTNQSLPETIQHVKEAIWVSL
jgi:thymidylate kinase